MTAPKPWLDSADAPADAVALLRRGRAPAPMDEQARRRSRARIAEATLVPAAAGALLWLPQLALGAILGAAGTALAVAAFEHRAPQNSAAHSAARQRAANETLPRAPHSAVLEQPPTPLQPASSARPTTSLPLPLRNNLDRELALLEAARRELAVAPARALEVLRTHEAQFGSGQLRIEREFLIVDALVRLNRRAEAEARAQALEAQAPQTIYGERLDRILGR